MVRYDICSPYYHNITNNTTTTAHHHHYQHHYHWQLPTLSLGGWPHRARWRTLAAAAWGGTTLTWREKQTLSFSRGDGRRRFFNFIEGSTKWVPWKRSEIFWTTFIWWCHIRWGIRSFVQWNLVESFVTRERMFVVSLSLFAIYLLPHFPTLHSS